MRAPRSLAVQRSIDREQSLRASRLFDLIHSAGFQRHRYRIRFISAGIVELAIDQNGDRDQNSFAAAVELQESNGTRPLHLLFWSLTFCRLLLGIFLRAFELWHLRRAARAHSGDKRQNDDDGGPQSAV